MALAAESFSNDSAKHWMREIQGQMRRCDEENGVLRNLYKRAKADGQNVPAMRKAIRATKLDPTEVLTGLRDEIRYMGLRKIPVNAASLFDGFNLEVTDKTQREDDLWDAQDAGYRAGRHGAKIEDCPYTPGTEQFVGWQEHWQKGQASIAHELGPTGSVAAPRRGRRAAQARIPGTEEQDRPKPPRKAAAKKAARKGQRSAGRRGNGSGPRIAVEDGQPVY